MAIDPLSPHPGVDSAGLGFPVPSADGGVVMAGTDRAGRVVLVQLHRDGSRDTMFGVGGISRFDVPPPPFRLGPPILQLVRLADGSLLLVSPGRPTATFGTPLLLTRVLNDGRIDAAYGAVGTVTSGVNEGCGSCPVAAPTPDGGLVVAGETGSTAPRPQGTEGPEAQWIVQKLLANGTPDPAFGSDGTVVVAEPGATGFGVVVGGDGAITTVGEIGGRPYAVRLRNDGRPDPAFGAGAPVPLPPGRAWFSFVSQAGGAIDLLGSAGGDNQVLRLNAQGNPADDFGQAGTAAALPDGGFSVLNAAPDGGDVVAGMGERDTTGTLTATRLDARGAIVARVSRASLALGGGLASFPSILRPVIATPLRQSTFRAMSAAVRPDGSIVLPNAVAVVQYTGEGAGFETDRAAVVSLTPSLALDPTFGGPSVPAVLKLAAAGLRAVPAPADRAGIMLPVRTSGPGLARVSIRTGDRLLARSTAPVLRGGRQSLRILLIPAGRRRLKAARGRRVAVDAAFRDLLGRSAHARLSGRLR